jgi:hypothetical protein
MKFKLFLLSGLLVCVLAAFTIQSNLKGSGVCVACESLSGLEKVVCLVEDFKSSLTASQLSAAQLSYNLTNAAKWSNLPVNLAPRIGVRFGDLNADQLSKAKAILQEVMGKKANEGYDEADQLWLADQYLTQNGGGSSYGSGQYYMAFLGTPSTTGAWELQSGGHHLAIAETYGNGALTGATPSFRAVEPFAAFTINGGTYQPMVQERDSLAAMLASLTTAQQATAKLGTTFNDITLGPNKDWQFPTTKSGLKCSNLDASQKQKVLAAIRTYVDDVDSTSAAAFMTIYTAQLDDTYISYANNIGLTQTKDYVRIDGPRVWIEYSTQGGIVLSAPHPHSVWRDHQSDYGGLGNPSSGTQDAQVFDGKLLLFPNPGSSMTQVQLELPQAAVLGIAVYNQQGQQVLGEQRFNVTAGSHVLPINIQNLPAAEYQCVFSFKNADGSLARATRQLSKI